MAPHTVAGDPRLIGNITLDTEDFGAVVGYENHSGLTTLGSGARPFGTVKVGDGNNGKDSTEGGRIHHVIGTYLHGSLLPKNPAVADWLLARVAETGMLDEPLPRQIEFARMNLTYTITSKRKLKALVDEGIVSGWDDPRMTTIAGLRRRGFPPAAIRLFCERAGISKANQLIEMAVLEQTVREVLDPEVDRLHVITDPIRLVIENMDPAERILCEAPRHPHHPERGVRRFELSRELWIEREDFAENPPKGFFRMTPGQMVRLRHGFVVRCTGVDRDANGEILQVRCEYLPDTRSGTPGADSVKVKGNIHWVSASDAVPVELRIFAPLFLDAQPDAGGRDPLENINPDSKTVRTGYAEPLIREAKPEQQFQFERQGYYVADRFDHTADKPVFNRVTTLKDSFGKKKG